MKRILYIQLFTLINFILIAPCYSNMGSLLIPDKISALLYSSCNVERITIPVSGLCPPAETLIWENGTLHIVPGGHYQLIGSNIYHACELIAGGVTGTKATAATFENSECAEDTLSCLITINCHDSTCDDMECIPTEAP